MEVKKCVYTLGHFIEGLANKCQEGGFTAWQVNIQSDEALELFNQCLPRNLMVGKLFVEHEEGVSILDIKNE